MIWIAYSILKISLCLVGWTPPHIWVLVGGFHPIGARYVVQHLLAFPWEEHIIWVQEDQVNWWTFQWEDSAIRIQVDKLSWLTCNLMFIVN